MLLGAVSVMGLVPAANAADMYSAPAGPGGYKDLYVPLPAWTGFYVGVNGGYAFNKDSDNLVATSRFGTGIFAGAKPEGGFGGGQIGYNFGSFGFGPQFVFGVEADIQGAGIDDTRRSGPSAGVTADVRTNIDWFGTVRGRLGYAFDRTLVYATGGFAFGNVERGATAIVPAVGAFLRKNDTETGYAVGGGIEHKFMPNWSVKLEYQYINLGDTTLTGVGLGTGLATNSITTDFHTVRVGLNYRIGQSYEPLK